MEGDKDLLAELIRRILPDIKFKDLTVIAQKTEQDGLDTHGVRFDIFATDENGRAIEIEMQVVNTGELPLRIRFYCSMIDMQMLKPGEPYGKLKETYVIMICPFDLYGKGRYVYRFRNREDKDPNLLRGDDTTKIVLNAAGTDDDVSEDLKVFLDYVAGKPSDDVLIQRLAR